MTSESVASKRPEHVESGLYWIQGHAEPRLPVPNTTERTTGSTVIICTYQRAESLDRFLDSLALQTHLPDGLIIVDASRDDSTEQSIKRRMDDPPFGIAQILYWRVAGPLRGLTHQRNFALQWVATDRLFFFDDDVVLRPNCLEQMEQAYLAQADQVVGVGARIENSGQSRSEALIWRLTLLLRMVSNLEPGRYHRSGIATTWGNLPYTDEVIEVNWLSGCANLWKTTLVCELGFYDDFAGYGLGEDLDFGLRAARHGKLLVACGAHVLHLHASGGRPDFFKLGYMEIDNRYQIHRRNLLNRTGRDVAWFIYAWTLDTLLLARHLLYPSRWQARLLQTAGRCKAAFDLVTRRR